MSLSTNSRQLHEVFHIGLHQLVNVSKVLSKEGGQLFAYAWNAETDQDFSECHLLSHLLVPTENEKCCNSTEKILHLCCGNEEKEGERETDNKSAKERVCVLFRRTTSMFCRRLETFFSPHPLRLNR